MAGAETRMANACQECGAPLPEGVKCIDYFHALLLLEYEVIADSAVVVGERGLIAHFYAVSSYVLQHPEGMNYTDQALAGLRHGLAEHLTGTVTLSEQRHRVRRAAEGDTRVTRRAGDQVVRWPVDHWPLTVVDVLAGGVDGYCERVAEWAKSILRTLDSADL